MALIKFGGCLQTVLAVISKATRVSSTLNTLEHQAAHSVSIILDEGVCLSSNERLIMLFDSQCLLAKILFTAYISSRQVQSHISTVRKQFLFRFEDIQSIDSIDAIIRNTLDMPNVTIAIDVDKTEISLIEHLLDHLKSRDLVVCIQSTSFQQRFKQYRLRLKLFEKSLKMIEHVHLGVIAESQISTYLDSLSFSPCWWYPIANRMKKQLDAAKSLTLYSSAYIPRSLADLSNEKAWSLARMVLESSEPGPVFSLNSHLSAASAADPAAELVQPYILHSDVELSVIKCALRYGSGLEPCKLNTGDYSNIRDVGGTYPVGEVFSESRLLDQVDGICLVWAYPNTQRLMSFPGVPFRLFIKQGRVVGVDPHSPLDFRQMLAEIRHSEGQVWLREFGIGLNPAMSANNPVNDVVAFERQQGIHLSIGKKHTVYKKSAIERAVLSHVTTGYHDVSVPPILSADISTSADNVPRNQRRYGRFHFDVFLVMDTIQLEHADPPSSCTMRLSDLLKV